MPARRFLLSALAATAALAGPAAAADPVGVEVCSSTGECVWVDAGADEGDAGVAASASLSQCSTVAELVDRVINETSGIAPECGAGAAAATSSPSSVPVNASCARSGALLKASISAGPNYGSPARYVSITCIIVANRSTRGYVSGSTYGSNVTSTSLVPPSSGREKICFSYNVSWTDGSSASYSMFGRPDCQTDES